MNKQKSNTQKKKSKITNNKRKQKKQTKRQTKCRQAKKKKKPWKIAFAFWTCFFDVFFVFAFSFAFFAFWICFFLLLLFGVVFVALFFAFFTFSRFTESYPGSGDVNCKVLPRCCCPVSVASVFFGICTTRAFILSPLAALHCFPTFAQVTVHELGGFLSKWIADYRSSFFCRFLADLAVQWGHFMESTSHGNEAFARSLEATFLAAFVGEVRNNTSEPSRSSLVAEKSSQSVSQSPKKNAFNF